MTNGGPEIARPCADCTPDGLCADHAPQPGDEELGKALMKMWGDQIVARCIDPKCAPA